MVMIMTNCEIETLVHEIRNEKLYLITTQIKQIQWIT